MVQPSGAVTMDASQRKRYRDRVRYMQMTSDQREMYLQRNREHKRMKRVASASSSNAQCVTRDASMNTHGNIHLPTESSRMTEGKEIAVTLLQEEDFPSSSSNIHSSMIHQPRCSAKRKRVTAVGSFDVSASEQHILLQPNMCHPNNDNIGDTREVLEYDNHDDESYMFSGQDLIRKLLNILSSNPYVQIFRSLGSIPNLAEYRIELNTNIALDQRVYNAPTASQVAAIWVEGSDPRGHFDRSIMVYGISDRPQYIKAYHGCYDPLSYPLLFPNGEVGWNLDLPRVSRRVRTSIANQLNTFDEGKYIIIH
ncbi:hypothetical protein ACQ4PT_020566 [Festuca glaucescens]